MCVCACNDQDVSAVVFFRSPETIAEAGEPLQYEQSAEQEQGAVLSKRQTALICNALSN